MKKIRVYLQYPLGISDSQYYKSMIDNPPERIEFVSGGNRVGMISSRKFFWLSNFLKKQIRFWTDKLGLVIVNVHSSPVGKSDLIHCAHCLSKEKKEPWILDVESLWQLWISGRDKSGAREKVLKYLMRDNCKKIIAWTEATKKDIVETFPEVADKVEVVYYGMKMHELGKKKDKGNITLFFSGRHFYAKGGLHATEVMDKLTRKHNNVCGVINGAIPNDIIKKYSGNEKLKFYQLMPYEDVLKLYRDSDIFVYPGYSDSFGFIFMDAMAFGVPIITVDGYARKEIIEDGVTGFVLKRSEDVRYRDIEKRIIGRLVEKVEILIRDKKLRKRMGQKCIENIRDGKFSVKKRNEKLKLIYKEALMI